MEKNKLNPKVIKLQAKIITPIHIDNGEVLDRMDYFLLGEDWDELQILDRKWLKLCAKKDRELFNEIIKSIENGDFIKLENLKIDFYNRYINDFIDEYGVLDDITIGKKAKKSLLQDNDYSTNKNQNGNQGEIKRFSRFGIEKELFIPGSTLKGIFRTISLFSKVSDINNYGREKKEKFIENIDKGSLFKDTFSFISFEDININYLSDNLEIQEINSKNKPPREGQAPKTGISQVMEVIKNGDFEIKLSDLNSKILNEKLKEMLRKYSEKLILREKQILDNIGFRTDFISELDNYHKEGHFPIKIGMFKKSGSYKLFWDEMIEELNRIKGKEWLNEARRKGIGDKMIYLDENQNPVGWITIKILDN